MDVNEIYYEIALKINVKLYNQNVITFSMYNEALRTLLGYKK